MIRLTPGGMTGVAAEEAAVMAAEALPASAAACQVVPAALGESIGDYAALAVAEEAGE